MLNINNITKYYYKKSGRKKIVFSNFSYDLPQKSLVYLAGGSGSGKSTLLNMISGNDLSYEGDIFFNDTSLKNISNNELLIYRLNNISYVYQNKNLINELTIYENIVLVFKILNLEPNAEEIINYLDKFKILDCKDKYPYQISLGQYQRASIIRALIKKPKILICDEPTSALDKEIATEIMGYLKEISLNILVIVVSHDRDLMGEYYDFILDLNEMESYTYEKLIDNKKDNNEKEMLFFNRKPIISLALKKLTRNLKKTLLIVLLFSFFSSILISCLSLKLDKGQTFEYFYDKQEYLMISTSNNDFLNKYKDLIKFKSFDTPSIYDSGNNGYFRGLYTDTYINIYDLDEYEILGNGTFPTNEKQILVTKYFADFYYIKKDLNPDYNAIIGKDFKGFEVSGVINFEPDPKYRQIDTSINESLVMHLKGELIHSGPYALYSAYFGISSEFDEVKCYYLNKNIKNLNEFIEDIESMEGVYINNSEYYFYEKIMKVKSFINSLTKYLIIIVSVVFLLISSLVIHLNHNRLKQDFVNLFKLGIDKKTIFLIPLSMTILISTVVLVISLIFNSIILNLINAFVMKTWGFSNYTEIFNLASIIYMIPMILFVFAFSFLSFKKLKLK